MRTLRNLGITAVAVCSGLSLFFHFAGLGAFFGAIVVVYLWRDECWAWAKPKLAETWRRVVFEFWKHS